MLRYVHTLWSSFFPAEPVYPIQIVGMPEILIEGADEIERVLRESFRLFTYRDQFEGIASDYRLIHTDQGWGCLLRTTQMMLAHFLLCYTAEADHQLRFFYDKSGSDAPFSIHNMVHSVWSGRTFKPDYWSPSQGCEAIRRTVQQAVEDGVLRTVVRVICASNGCLFSRDVLRALRDGASVVLLLIPVRASSAAQLTQETYLQVETLLGQPQCAGMVGGIPGRSYYFFGYNQSQLLYLDPHQRTQAALVCSDPLLTDMLLPTRDDVRCVHWSCVDTSFFLAFAVRSVREWRQLSEHLTTKFLHVEGRTARSTASGDLHATAEAILGQATGRRAPGTTTPGGAQTDADSWGALSECEAESANATPVADACEPSSSLHDS